MASEEYRPKMKWSQEVQICKLLLSRNNPLPALEMCCHVNYQFHAQGEKHVSCDARGLYIETDRAPSLSVQKEQIKEHLIIFENR